MRLTIRLSLFGLAAIVLVIFAIIAGANTNGNPPLTFIGVSWFIWVCAALLAAFIDKATGYWAPWLTGPPQQEPPQ